MTKIVVTGSAGFLGSHVVSAALEAGHQVVGIDRRPRVRLDQDVLETEGRYQEHILDLLDPPEDLHRLFEGAGALIHTAARIRESPEAVHRTNVEGTAVLLRTLRSLPPLRLVFISSMVVHVASPDAYALSKREGEGLVRNSAMDFTIIRPSMIYGREDPLWTAGLKRKLKGPSPLFLPGAGRARIQPLYVVDAARAVLAAACTDKGVKQTFELGGPEPIAMVDFLRQARRALEGRACIVSLPLWVLRIGRLVFGKRFTRALDFYGKDHLVDISPAKQALGFSPRPPEEGVPLAFS